MTDTVTLDAELGIASASTLAETLTERRGDDVTLDASGVNHVCAPVVQVLLAAKMAWDGDGKSLTVADPSDPFRTCLDLLGLGDQILGDHA